MSRTTMCMIFAVAAMAFVCGVAVAQETTPEQQKAMEAYAKAGALNENHAFLKSFAGDWDVSTSAWMQPGAPPSVGTASCAGQIVLGGRFLMMRFTGIMFGQPFEGIQITGFDNIQNKFTTFWVDNTSTAFYLLTGTRKPGANTIDDSGMWPDPMTGGLSKVHAVTTVVGPDEYTYALYMVGADGKEFKSMEYRAVRRK